MRPTSLCLGENIEAAPGRLTAAADLVLDSTIHGQHQKGFAQVKWALFAG